MTITLPSCKHTFTVETLDGHCQLSSYYTQDIDGHWTGLSSPPIEYKSPPTCPTCRAAIKSPRYGRVFKRADLLILERNVALRMAHSLDEARTLVLSTDTKGMKSSLEKDIGRTSRGATAVPALGKETAAKKLRTKVIKQIRDLPVQWDVLDPSSVQFHVIPPKEAKQWSDRTNSLRQAYGRVFEVAKTRSAHLNAWESAFASLYRKEIDSAVQDPTRAPRHPEEHAMRMAKMKVGQPKPLVDRRFCVEAFWLSLDIRFLLVELAQVWLNRKQDSSNEASHRAWSSYVYFILKTCVEDSKIAVEIASQSESYRQASRTKVFHMQSEQRLFKFNYQMLQISKLVQEEREELANKARIHKKQVRSMMAEETNFRQKNGLDLEAALEFETTFLVPGEKIREEWERLETCILLDTFYTPVSDEDRYQIVSALRSEFSKLLAALEFFLILIVI